MKHFLLLILACNTISICSTHAQPVKNYKYYISKQHELLSSSQEAAYYRVLQVDAEGATFVEKYMNDKLRRSGQAASRSSKYTSFQPHGTVISYYPSGKLARLAQYNKGRITGRDSCYYENGQLQSVRTYKYKLEEGRTVTNEYILSLFDSNGTQLVKAGNGYFKTQGPDSLRLMETPFSYSAIEEAGEIKDSCKNGWWEGRLQAGKFKEHYTLGHLDEGLAYPSDGGTLSYSKLMQRPTFQGDMRNFYKYMAREFRYPRAAREARADLEVRIMFVVDVDGTLTDLRIIEDPGLGTAEEVIRVLKNSGKWESARFHGFPVRMSFTLPVKLKMNRQQL